MTLQFERYAKVARYLDPQGEFAERAIPCEVRRDPLTGRSGRVAHVAGFHPHPVDFSGLIEATRAGCPFCPERILAVTPRFPPDLVADDEGAGDGDGRVRRGQTTLVPNLAPYDEHSAVAVMSRDHYVPLDAFTPELLADAFAASIAYFRSVQRQPRTTYQLAFWNYLPASGGTQIHPHLQLFATDTPGNTLEEELAASAHYFAAEGRPYWADLVREEARLGERMIAEGRHSVWLTSFVSQSLLADVLAIFPEQRTLTTLPDDALDEFCRGLSALLRQLAAQGIYSFNLAWFPGTPDREDVWLHARLSPRVYLTPRIWGTDTSALQHLYGEHFMVQTPEDAASGLRTIPRL